MSTDAEFPEAPLEAGSPFELRVDLGKHVPETSVRQALASGDMGFLHSFTTGSAVDGPGVRVVAPEPDGDVVASYGGVVGLSDSFTPSLGSSQQGRGVAGLA